MFAPEVFRSDSPMADGTDTGIAAVADTVGSTQPSNSDTQRAKEEAQSASRMKLLVYRNRGC